MPHRVYTDKVVVMFHRVGDKFHSTSPVEKNAFLNLNQNKHEASPV